MGLALEILGLVLFLGAHVFVTMRDHRAALIKTLGAGPTAACFRWFRSSASCSPATASRSTGPKV